MATVLRLGAPRMSLLKRFAAVALIAHVLLAVTLSYFLGRAIERNALAEATLSANDTLHARLLHELRPADLTHPMNGSRYHQFQWFVGTSILSGRTVRVKVWNQWGMVTYSDDRRIVGRRFPIDDDLASALRGTVASDTSNLTAAENLDDRRFHRLLEVYLPIRFKPGGPVVGAFEVYQTYDPIAKEIAGTQHMAYLLVAAGFILLYLLLFGIVQRGSRTITQQQRDLRRYTQELERSYSQTIGSLAAAVDARDANTEQHSERVTRLAVALGRHLGLTATELADLEHGALLHDVGKIGVSDTILLKPGKLTDGEWVQMRRHPEIGYDMLREVTFLAPALDVIRHHHERWDGTGYPDRLRGETIPLAARLFAVIDVYDALTSDRPYRPAMTHEEAMAHIKGDAGTHFDPAMVAVFAELMRQSGTATEKTCAALGPSALAS